jgi:hypothetical protein
MILRGIGIAFLVAVPLAAQVAYNSTFTDAEYAANAIRSTGAEVARGIDWARMPHGSPIPRQMPVGQSDDPTEAGFALQWITNVAIQNGATNAVGYERTAIAIASEKKQPDDNWAIEVEQQIRRGIMQLSETEKPTLSRVFCNAQGCLIYYERHGNWTTLPDQLLYKSIGSGGNWAKTHGFGAIEADGCEGSTTDGLFWALTVIKRPVAVVGSKY